ncbi:MAG: beta-propeller fold lactonase family protein [Paludibacter sp.]|nr:beta-propeller fold lactonase family protein [Paludibacter sp.]MBP8023021.1 beta-propeller fold lactonase family protein [Paludibacter sp.]MBP8782727.1 beta-propeller fold lactonase family protein [Paludibacter sp.]
MKIKILLLSSLLFSINLLTTAQVQRIEINTASTPANAEIRLKLVQRFQQYNQKATHTNDKFDTTINSPKSVNILDQSDKFYVHSLEGCRTSVYRLSDFKLIKSIPHVFNASNQYLFSETDYFDYKYRTKDKNLNYFSGKPVESCFSHNGKYLWVTYYRRTYDLNAIDPSAVCIIDTEADTIVRVMPTAPLPKMISCSPDNRTIAVTHWGDNTIALIDIQSDNPADFKYLKNIAIDRRLSLSFAENDTIDRDNNCGNCLRGTVFTPDNKYVLVGKMGSNSVAVVDVETQKHIGSIFGMRNNMRHLIISKGNLYLSINKTGYVQKANLKDLLLFNEHGKRNKIYSKWQSVFVGEGARTIVADPSGKYIFAAANNKSTISVVRTSDMKVVAQCPADSYPVGMDISSDGKTLIVTSQGKSGGGGNSVMVYKIEYSETSML